MMSVNQILVSKGGEVVYSLFSGATEREEEVKKLILPSQNVETFSQQEKKCIKPLTPTNVFGSVLSRIKTDLTTKILVRLVEIILEKGI